MASQKENLERLLNQPQVAAALNLLARWINIIGPYYVRAAEHGYHLYTTLPIELAQALVGLGLCFFGGTYVASIAAIEAARQLGWQKVVTEVTVVREQLQICLLYTSPSPRDRG